MLNINAFSLLLLGPIDYTVIPTAYGGLSRGVLITTPYVCLVYGEIVQENSKSHLEYKSTLGGF